MEPGDGTSATQPDATDKRVVGRPFEKGNKFGKGNPYARRQAELKRLWLDQLNELHVQAAYKNAYERMMEGDAVWGRIWLDYGLGKVKEVAGADETDDADAPMVIAPPEPMTGAG